MIQLDWVNLLKDYGDPIEKRGLRECGLGNTFPKYAEFWAYFAFTNRDREDPSKLKRELEPRIANIIYHHYGVFYQLTFAYSQINDFSSPLVDIATPFYHLATAVDLIERTFVFTFNYHDSKIARLSHRKFKRETASYWNSYNEKFDNFAENLVPFVLPIHNATKSFARCVHKSRVRKKFSNNSSHIRQYRNLLTHALPPLKLNRNGKIYIPTIDKIGEYRDKNWSILRDRINPADYAPAEEVITGLADELVVSTNDLWEVLIDQMKNILPMAGFKNIMETIYELDPKLAPGDSDELSNDMEHGNRESPPQIPQSPTHPSGIKTYTEGDPF